MSTKKPVLILQLRPEDAISDSEFACFLKYGRLQPENTERMRIERLGIPDTVSLDHYSAIIVGGSPFDISTPENRKAPIQKKIENDFKRLLDEVVERDFPFLGACSGNGLLGSLQFQFDGSDELNSLRVSSFLTQHELYPFGKLKLYGWL